MLGNEIYDRGVLVAPYEAWELRSGVLPIETKPSSPAWLGGLDWLEGGAESFLGRPLRLRAKPYENSYEISAASRLRLTAP